jgi:hypothetical protein
VLVRNLATVTIYSNQRSVLESCLPELVSPKTNGLSNDVAALISSANADTPLTIEEWLIKSAKFAVDPD